MEDHRMFYNGESQPCATCFSTSAFVHAVEMERAALAGDFPGIFPHIWWVLGYTAVFVNGVCAARNFSGYNRFTCDVSAYLLSGQENTIALQVDATRCEGWWYEGAGLYRPARIQFRGNSFFREEDCFVRCEKQGDRFLVKADLAVVGDGVVTAELVDKDGNRIAAGQGENICLEVAGGHLWSPEDPYLYKCSVQTAADRVESYFALRTISIEEKEGKQRVCLNGKPIFLHTKSGGHFRRIGRSLTTGSARRRITQNIGGGR